MRNDVDIDQLMQDTWLTVSLLRQGAITPDGDALYKNCCRQVDDVRNALQQAGYDDASIGHISYAQCALLDETVMSRKAEERQKGEPVAPDEGQRAWRTVPLQAKYFGSLHAGEAVWDRIAEVLRQPAPVEAVLVCYHRIIALGFQGLFSVKAVSQTQRDATFSALQQRVPVLGADLSLLVHRCRRGRDRPWRSLWFWTGLAALLSGLVWLAGHHWLQTLLSSQLPELRQ